MTFRSYNTFHLGDNLVHLHFLRALAKAYPFDEFEHGVQACHLTELAGAVVDLPQIRLVGLVIPPEPAHGPKRCGRNVWKNAGDYWQNHPRRADHVAFSLDWFRFLAAEMGLVSPLHTADDLLFDYPTLRLGDFGEGASDVDVLVINSQPCSGQLKGYTTREYLTPLILDLARAGVCVAYTQPLFLDRQPSEEEKAAATVSNLLCTREIGMDLSAIGRLSQRCRMIAGVATGPLWPCLNVWNRAKPMGVLLDHVLGDEDLTGLNPNLRQFRTVEELQVWLKCHDL